MRATVLGLVLALALTACADDGENGGSTDELAPTTAGGEATTEDTCDAAAASLGVADPPSDLAGVGAEAETIAASTAADAVGAGVDPRLVVALAAVNDGAVLLANAANADDRAAIADAAATLTAAYDELDLVAADLRLAACGSESWGRQVAIAAVDLTGAGG